MDLNVISITLGLVGCVSLISAFACQLNEIRKSRDAKGTSWGLIGAQIITCLAFGSSAAINVRLGGMINMPFLVANVILFALFLIMAYMKYQFDVGDIM